MALAVAAQATRTLRFGTLVLDNDFRHPTVLAKEAATLDLLTDGRFEIGLGPYASAHTHRRAWAANAAQAAREADIIGVTGSDESRDERMALIRAEAGERYRLIEFNTLYMRVQVDGQPEQGGSAYSDLAGLMGSRSAVIEYLPQQRELVDISYVVIIGSAIDAFAPVVATLAGR